jgi:hypothetical protein
VLSIHHIFSQQPFPIFFLSAALHTDLAQPELRAVRHELVGALNV